MSRRLFLLLGAVSLQALFAAATPIPAATVRSEACIGPEGSNGWAEASPRVHAWHDESRLADGRFVLCLLVLWRGEDGWYRHRHAAMQSVVESGLIDSAAAVARGQRPKRWPKEDAYWETLGDIDLEVKYDPFQRRVWILNREIALGSDNVVLIDRADGVGGAPELIRTLAIDSRLTSLDVATAELVRRSQDLLEFIR